MKNTQVKRIGIESRLEDFAEGDIVEIKAPETIFSFRYGIIENPLGYRRGRIYEREKDSMLLVFKDETGWTCPIDLREYVRVQGNRIALDWTTTVRYYDSEKQYKKYIAFLREVNL